MNIYNESVKNSFVAFKQTIKKQQNIISEITARVFESLKNINLEDISLRLINFVFSPSYSLMQVLIKGVTLAALSMGYLGLVQAYDSHHLFRVCFKVMFCAIVIRKIQNWSLQWACHKGHKKVVKALILSGANLNAKNFLDNLAPLHYAAMKGHLEIVKLLIESGANVKLGGGIGRFFRNSETQAIRYAVYHNHLDIIKTLHTMTPLELKDLHAAVGAGQSNIVNWMMQEYHFDIEAPFNDRTPLYIACELGNEAMVRLLVKTYHANVDSLNTEVDLGHASKGHRPLHIAAIKGYVDIVRFLVEECQADLLAKTEDQNTIAHMACRYKKLEILKYLDAYVMSGKLNINEKNAVGNTPLHCFVNTFSDEAVEILKFLLTTWTPNVNETNSIGATALHVVAKNGTFAGVKILIDHGAKINMRDHSGQTSIHYAAKSTVNKQKIEILQELIANGASIDEQDDMKRTPLHLAVIELHYKPEELISLIHTLHADINLPDINGRTPYHIACIYQFQSFIDILEKADANPNIKDIFGHSPLDYKRMPSSQRIQYIYSDGNYSLVAR